VQIGRFTPPSRLLILDENHTDTLIHRRFVKDIGNILKSELDEYKNMLPKSKLNSLKSFVERDFKSPHHRTLVTSLYSFLLQEKSLEELMNKKGSESGSIEPFLIHLRKGTIILETIFKEIYPSLSGLTLGQILHNDFVIKDSGFKLQKTNQVGSTLEDLVRILIPYLDRQRQVEVQNKWITVAHKLRNVTSHGLPWSEVIDESIYKNLHRNILFSIFYLIDYKYI
jgi:hypothetical protein